MKLVKRSDSVQKETNQFGITRRSFMRNTSLAAGGAVVGARDGDIVGNDGLFVGDVVGANDG